MRILIGRFRDLPHLRRELGETKRIPYMGTDGLKKQLRKLHGAATKKGIKQAKARKVVVKKATLALRKTKKQEIVHRLFMPRSAGTPKD